MGDLREKVLSVFFPKTCPLCERVIYNNRDICSDCEASLHMIDEPKCYKCGKALSTYEKIMCNDCRKLIHHFEKGAVLFEYKDEIRQSLYRFKYKNQRNYARFYAKTAAEKYLKNFEEWNINKIVPVPMYNKKKVIRGYNQAEELAKSLSGCTGIPMDNKCLIRIKNTIAQKGLSNQERRANMNEAFAVKVSEVKKGENVLLVDDIYTTGSTIDSCSRILKKAGVQKVYFLCVAAGKDK